MVKNSAKNIVLIIFSMIFSLASLAIAVYLYAYGSTVDVQRDLKFFILTTAFSFLPPFILALYSMFFYFKRIALGLISLSPVFAAFYFAVYIIYDFILAEKLNYDTITILRIVAFFLLMFITRQLMRYAFYVKGPIVAMTVLCFALPVYSIIQSHPANIGSAVLTLDMSFGLYLLSLLLFTIGFENRVPKTFDEDDESEPDEPELPTDEEETQKTLDN